MKAQWLITSGFCVFLFGLAACGDDSSGAVCGNGRLGLTEQCDCGHDASNLPVGCVAPNGAPGSTCTEECLLVPAEDCFNGGVDDDLDGLADCADPDCVNHPHCVPEVCDDGIDNNGNGLLDCADPDCEGAVACLPEVCDNGVDDNGDGHADCQDEDCAGEASCAGVEVCWNGLDDDGNGYVDCDDPQCADLTECTTEVCDNGLDDDGDNRVDCADRSCIERPPCDQTGCTTDADLTVTLDASEMSVAHVSTDIAVAGDDLDGPCDVTNGKEYVIAINLLDSGHLHVVYHGQGRYKIGLYFKGGPGSGCTAALGFPCDTTSLNGSGVLDYGVLPSSKYFLVVAEANVGLGGLVDLTLSLQEPSHPAEQCDNELDDDGNGETDCGDIACYDRPTLCENPAGCTASALGAEDLGTLSPGASWDTVEATMLDTRMESNDLVVGCGGAGGADHLYAFHLDAPAILQVAWSQTMDHHGDHVFALLFPGGGCTLSEHRCFDPQGAQFGVATFPGDPSAGGVYPAGDYYLAVESVQGGAGLVDFQLFAMAVLGEVCDDWGFDNDGDGKINCDDEDCANHNICIPELCNNGIDDDHDGKVDCQDLDPDDSCECSYFCKGRAGSCDFADDPEIIDLGMLQLNHPVPFDINTIGAQADYNIGWSCVSGDPLASDLVLAFEVPMFADVTVAFTDEADHVGVFYKVDPCASCSDPSGFIYCYDTGTVWYRPSVVAGKYGVIVRPRISGAGAGGRIYGTVEAN